MTGSNEAARTSRLGWTALASATLGYALLLLISGVADSPLVPVLPAGVHPAGWIARAADALALSDLSRAQLIGLSIALVAWVLLAFAVVLREAWAGRIHLPVAMIAVGVVVGMSVVAPVLLSRDVYSYAAYGRIMAIHGSNPYLQPPSAFPTDPFVAVASPEWIHARSVYGPVFTLISAAIARVASGSPAGTIFAFKVLAGASLVGAALLGAMAARLLHAPRAAAAVVAIGLNPVLVLHTVGGAHNDALVAVCLAGAFVLAVRATGASKGASPPEVVERRLIEALGATLLLAAAVLIKAVVFPLLLLWLWQVWRGGAGLPRRRTKELAVHVGAVAIAAIAAFVPVQAGWSTVRALLSVSSRQGWASGPGLVARGGRALGRTVAGSATGAVLETTVSAGFAALFLWLFWRLLRRAMTTPAPDPDAWGVSMLLLALAAPYLLPWYAAWFVPFLALMNDDLLSAAGFAVASFLAMTGIPAEAGGTPQLWRDMMLVVHYGVAPVMLGLLGFVGWRVVRLTRLR